jgi:hypothetical protein
VVNLNDVERGQRLGALDESLQVVVLLAQPTKKLEDEVSIRQLLAQGVEHVRHAIHLATVVANVIVPCLKGWNHSSS